MRKRDLIAIVFVFIGLLSATSDRWMPQGWLFNCPGGDSSALCSSGALCGCSLNMTAAYAVCIGILLGLIGAAVLAYDLVFAKKK